MRKTTLVALMVLIAVLVGVAVVSAAPPVMVPLCNPAGHEVSVPEQVVDNLLSAGWRSNPPCTPDDDPGDEPGDEIPGDDEPGDEIPGDDEPGDGVPGDEIPGDVIITTTTTHSNPATPRQVIDLLWGIRPGDNASSDMRVFLIVYDGDNLEIGDAAELLDAPAYELGHQYLRDDAVFPGNFSYIANLGLFSPGANYFRVLDQNGDTVALIRIDSDGNHLEPIWTAFDGGSQVADPLYPGISMPYGG